MNGKGDGADIALLRCCVCAECGTWQTLDPFACRVCASTQLDQCQASGRGHIWAITTVHRAPSEAFRDLAPYVLLLVDLDEGGRVMAHGAAGLAIGDRVQAYRFEHHGKTLLGFGREET